MVEGQVFGRTFLLLWGHGRLRTGIAWMKWKEIVRLSVINGWP